MTRARLIEVQTSVVKTGKLHLPVHLRLCCFTTIYPTCFLLIRFSHIEGSIACQASKPCQTLRLIFTCGGSGPDNVWQSIVKPARLHFARTARALRDATYVSEASCPNFEPRAHARLTGLTRQSNKQAKPAFRSHCARPARI